MVGENFEIYMSEMAKNHLKLSTMVGENCEIYMSQMFCDFEIFLKLFLKVYEICRSNTAIP